MEISQVLKNDTLHIALIGQLWQKEDLTVFEKTIASCVQEQRKRVVLDLQRLSFINSQGLGLLVRFYNCMVETGCQLVLSTYKSSILDVIEISGFDEFMTIAKNEQDLEQILKAQN